MDAAGGASRTLTVCRDPEDLGLQAAARVSRWIREAVARHRRASLALAGGATPRTLYQALSRPPFADAIPWSRVDLFWGDERCVPPDHPESNYRMADETLISKIPIPPENVHRMRGELPTQEAAEAYEEELRGYFKIPTGGWPRFDLVLLGIGADGHTASLFPGSTALQEQARWVAAPYVEQFKAHRLTLTLPVLNHAAHVLFLVAGREKADILRRVLAEEDAAPLLPARLIRPVRGKFGYFIDAAAHHPVRSETLPSAEA